MKLIIQDTAHKSIDSIFEYLANYSVTNAISTIEGIYKSINTIQLLPNIGKAIHKISNQNFKELIYKQKRTSYRIIYFISYKTKTIYILSISNQKQDFNRILKLHNYFKNFLDF